MTTHEYYLNQLSSWLLMVVQSHWWHWWECNTHSPQLSWCQLFFSSRDSSQRLPTSLPKTQVTTHHYRVKWIVHYVTAGHPLQTWYCPAPCRIEKCTKCQWNYSECCSFLYLKLFVISKKNTQKIECPFKWLPYLSTLYLRFISKYFREHCGTSKVYMQWHKAGPNYKSN